LFVEVPVCAFSSPQEGPLYPASQEQNPCWHEPWPEHTSLFPSVGHCAPPHPPQSTGHDLHVSWFKGSQYPSPHTSQGAGQSAGHVVQFSPTLPSQSPSPQPDNILKVAPPANPRLTQKNWRSTFTVKFGLFFRCQPKFR